MLNGRKFSAEMGLGWRTSTGRSRKEGDGGWGVLRVGLFDEKPVPHVVKDRSWKDGMAVMRIFYRAEDEGRKLS